ncbi:YfgM family protein [Marinobacter fonticola]|uniref:YfgM family protein n=1 Tax=Marinobacter fonticola TaxID=2603215 RepID=UPI0011E68A90|nr:tetratricopeptide repeat protein [Marinobacter fonticola]
MELRTEEEQVAAIKDWWKKNGAALLIGIGAALAIVFGWQAWQQHQAEQLSLAASKYQQLLSSMNQPANDEQEKTIGFVANQLQEDHEDSPYAVYGTLILASHQFTEKSDPQAAVDSYKWALARAPEGSLKTVINQRLAQAQFATDDSEAALDTLRSVEDPGEFKALYSELEGDILRAQGDMEGAREAYLAAREASGPAPNPILELKMADMAIGEDA